MRKKLQIFVSSTYLDLKEERQACVETILKAGHIPAGMELFSAGDESQLELIKRWIEDSDVFLLILGGRYGSIEPKSQLSYIEYEYRYAIELKKPFFSLVMSEEYLNQKAKKARKKVTEYIERINYQKYQDFKQFVLRSISQYFSSVDQIKLEVSLSLNIIQSRHGLNGWIKFDEIPDISNALEKIQHLTNQNKVLEDEIKNIRTSRDMMIGIHFYDTIVANLESIEIVIPPRISRSDAEAKYSLLEIFMTYHKELEAGISNGTNASDLHIFLMQNIVSHLEKYTLVEIYPKKNDGWKHIRMSKNGEKLYYRHLLDKFDT